MSTIDLAPIPQGPLTEKGVALRHFFDWLNKLRDAVLNLKYIHIGRGNPNGTEYGSVGHLFLRTDGGASTTLYVKESGANTTAGWVAK